MSTRPTDAQGDDELLRRYASGDDDAFTEFVVRHHESVVAWVTRRIGSRPEVDDIVQETFMSVMSSASNFEGSSTARAWVYGIARNRIARQFRRRTAEPATFESLGELGLRAGWGDPEVEASRAESIAEVHRALKRLPDDAREIIELRDLEGFSNPEVAQILEMNVPAVKSRLHRARLALMAELNSEVADG